MDGIVLIDKEKGISSFGVVAKVRKIFNIKKVGHCGTLDPEATGVLPVMIGNATKVSKYLVEHDKEYVATLKLGQKTDSADGEGTVIAEDDFVLNVENEQEYVRAVEGLVGKQVQVPPMYSAIKVNGKKLYEYARAGQKIEREGREIEIYSACVERIDYEANEIVYRVACSKGTYIRTLCELLAERLGTVGFMKELRRTKVDQFCIEDSVKLAEIGGSDDKSKFVKSIEMVFGDKESVVLSEKKTQLFLNGVMLTFDKDDGVYRVYNSDEFVGIGVMKDGLLKRDVVVKE